MRHLTLLLVVALCATSAPTRAASEVATSDEVAYAEGATQAQPEIADAFALIDAGLPHLPFRFMAANSREMTRQFASSPTMVAFLLGRASAFDAAADLTGEP